MQGTKIFKVLVALTMQSYAGQRKLAGIFRFLSGKYSWDITLLRSASELTLEAIENLKRDTDGYIVSLHESAELRQALVKTGKPIIFIDDPDLKAISRNENAAFLKTDHIAIGKAAADHFLGLSLFATFAYVHPIGETHWSTYRAEGFARALRRKNKTAVIYDGGNASSDHENLMRWIKSLPKPAAIFAAFDDRAVDVINCCRECNIKIPRDVMVLGVGDDELVCNSCRPTISSLRIPFEGHGFAAARELQARMMRPINRKIIITASSDCIVTKRQTTASKSAVNAIVHDGLAFISAYATSGIKVPDVVKHLKVSRRLADLRFQQAKGKSILQTIIETKTEAAKHLLQTSSLSIADIASRCGFCNANYFKNTFVRTVGMSPRAWRSAQQKRKKPH